MESLGGGGGGGEEREREKSFLAEGILEVGP